jgi:hypothetical protein
MKVSPEKTGYPSLVAAFLTQTLFLIYDYFILLIS